MRVPATAAVVLACLACAAPPRATDWYDPPPPPPTDPDRLHWVWSLDRPDPDPDAADVFVLDGFTTDAAAVQDLHRRRRHVVCYLELGAVGGQPDAGRFPHGLTADRLIRWDAPARALRDTVAPILADRLRVCRDKGFDAAALDRLAGAPDDVLVRVLDAARELRLPVGLVDRPDARADLRLPPSRGGAAGTSGTSTKSGS
ncbi:endo alpha-1,4 polygalactosaminidase [Catellatospora sp. KI3]|uniref:endo alpha-1,4 polygalactosaminidase n=1 Tax=Catellatospora sp. KI3 TaxID=3041620 RepID=UPI002482D1D2|nr:endo alpha-1,4 polygalactosaminidase [Catellatospora sp. KI3]MDI1459502.1 endo alpha-1,4 polygalactosaminidase [Catellatospora sp. KI3]